MADTTKRASPHFQTSFYGVASILVFLSATGFWTPVAHWIAGL